MKTPELDVPGLISEDGDVLIGDHIKLLASSQVSPEAAEQGALQPLVYLASDHQYFQFTYYYGNGDFYRGYGYAVQDAYAYGEVLGPYANDGRDDGYYVIDYVANESGPGVQGYITINTYYDATIDSDSLGVGGYGFADLVWGEGFFGLGSESGEAYNIYGEGTGDNTFNFSASADLIANDQEYIFTFYFANGDYYSGYGYASAGLYTVGQVIPISGPDQLDGGHYEINFVSDLGYETSNDTYVSVISYFDAATDSDGVGLGGSGSASYVWGESHAGLGSEWGYAYNGNFDSTGDNYFTNINSADIAFNFSGGDQIYEYTYHYGDGDYYVGRGIASPGTYFVGQVIGGIPNETNHLGYYSIDRVYSLGYESNAQGSVSVHTYFDGATDGDGLGSGGYGYANSVYGEGFNGLGSEVGYAYNIDDELTGDNYFTNASSADIYSTSGDQEFGFTYYFGDGDFYSGYGYTGSGTYQPGQVIGQFWNDTNNWGYYVIDYAYDLGYESIVDGSVYIHTYYDGATDADGMGGGGYGTAFSAFGGGNAGLGSEIGEAYNYLYDKSGDNAFSNTNSADLILGDQQYNYTYYYGNGDFYRGFGYAISGTYAKGQWLPGVSNDTNNPGYYLIDDVQELGYNTFENFVWITDYFDAAIDLDGIGIAGNGYASHVTGEGDDGLGSESGEAFNSDYLPTGDNLISNSSSADIALGVDQVFTFTYYYGDGDTYNGYGFANAGTYFAGQRLEFYSNDTSHLGYYIIDAVADLGYETDDELGYVYVDRYYDANTDLDGLGLGAQGAAANVWGVGYDGLGSEIGEAYNSFFENSDDNVFTNSNSADLAVSGYQEFGFTYYYGDGDYYMGYGHAAGNLYHEGQVVSGVYNDTGNIGYYIINYVEYLSSASYEGDYIVLQSYYDSATDLDGIAVGSYGTAYSCWGEDAVALGAESGEAYSEAFAATGDNAFSAASSADLLLPTTFSLIASSADKNEGDGSSKKFTFTLTRSGDLSQSCSVDWSVTASGAHPAGKDDFFTGGFRSGSIRFAQGEATRNISLRISGDTLYEPDEQFTVVLSNPVGGSIDPNFAEATGIIRNDDPIPLTVLSIAATAADKLEGSGSKRFTFTVTRSGDLSQASSAEWFLVGSGPNPAGPDDFLTDSFKSGVLRFKADESSRELSIRIRGDLTPEPDEQFSVVLFNAIGAFIEPSSAEAIGIIRNDDLISPAALSPRLSNPQSFAGGGSYGGDTVLPGSAPSLSPLTSEGVAAFTNPADLPFTHLLSNTSFH